MSIKDKLVQTAARKLLEGKLKRYGTIRNVALDTAQRKVTLDFHPTGEPESVIVTVIYEDMTKSHDAYILKISSANSNRIWLNHLFEDFLTGMEFPVKGAFGYVLKNLL